jgi:hypothetical protein
MFSADRSDCSSKSGTIGQEGAPCRVGRESEAKRGSYVRLSQDEGPKTKVTEQSGISATGANGECWNEKGVRNLRLMRSRFRKLELV